MILPKFHLFQKQKGGLRPGVSWGLWATYISSTHSKAQACIIPPPRQQKIRLASSENINIEPLPPEDYKDKTKLLSSSDPHLEPLFWHSFWHTIWKYMAYLFCLSIWQYLIFFLANNLTFCLTFSLTSWHSLRSAPHSCGARVLSSTCLESCSFLAPGFMK